MSYNKAVTNDDGTGLADEVQSDWGLSESETASILAFLENAADENGEVVVQVFDGDAEIPGDIDVAELTGGGVFTFNIDPETGQLVNTDTDEGVEATIFLAPGGEIIFIAGAGSDLLSVQDSGDEAGQSIQDGLFQTLLDGGAGDDTLEGASQADLMLGGAGDDNISTGAGADSIDGGEGDDSIFAGSGADSITGGEGDDEVSGGSGYDQYFELADKSDFTVTVEDGDLVLTSESSVDVLSGVEYVSFGDGGVIVGVADEDQADVARSYEIILERDPDAAGLQFWLQAQANGLSLTQIVDEFITSPEFGTIFDEAGVDLTDNEAFIRQIYEEGYGRDGDDAGVEFWTGILDDELLSRTEVVTLFVEAPEAVETFDETIRIIDDSDIV